MTPIDIMIALLAVVCFVGWCLTIAKLEAERVEHLATRDRLQFVENQCDQLSTENNHLMSVFKNASQALHKVPGIDKSDVIQLTEEQGVELIEFLGGLSPQHDSDE